MSHDGDISAFSLTNVFNAVFGYLGVYAPESCQNYT